MPKRLKIPFYAKLEAKRGLKERELNKAGLTGAEARILGITSGVERAKRLIKNEFIDEANAKAVARFYLRFRNRKTPKAETALRLWGGRRWGKLLAKIYYSK